MIKFTLTDKPFNPAEKLKEEDYFDNSFHQNPKAIGDFRFPAVNNGRYPRKHPIYDDFGHFAGYLADGDSSLGYTWNCIYSAGCFWVTHQTFHDTLHGGGSNVSLVAHVGTFRWSSRKKYDVIKTFSFGGNWSSLKRVFKLIDGKRELLYLAPQGFCVFDTYDRKIVCKVDFPRYLAKYNFDFALSPKVKMMAIMHSLEGEKDIIDGEQRYQNFIRLYNMETGQVMGEQHLNIDQHIRWKINYSESGRLIQVTSEEHKYTFELSV